MTCDRRSFPVDGYPPGVRSNSRGRRFRVRMRRAKNRRQRWNDARSHGISISSSDTNVRETGQEGLLRGGNDKTDKGVRRFACEL